jgi:hypothetical protein
MATTAGSSWFGHWLMDQVPMQMLAARFAPGIAHPRPLYSHEPAYLEALQLAAPARRIANEEALADRLAREVFEVLEIGRAQFDDLRQALLGADLMVSVEASHLDHALFMMPTTASLIILNPPARFMTTMAEAQRE